MRRLRHRVHLWSRDERRFRWQHNRVLVRSCSSHWWQQSDEDDETASPENEGSPPPAPTVTVTLDMQLKDPRLRILIETLRGSRKSSRAHRARVADKYELHDEGLHRIVLKDGEPGLALVVPAQARAAILARYHYSLADGGGHTGGQTMYDQIRLHYFWPDLERECHMFAAACETCGGTRSQGTIKVDPGSSPTPGSPFEVIHLDHKGTLPLSGGFCHVLVVVCALTKFTLYIPTIDTKASTTLRALRDHVFSIFGYPLVIIHDNGSAFANRLMSASEKLYGYRQVFVKPHTPQANGLAESAVKKLKLILDRHTREYQGWHHLVSMAQAAVNQRVSSGTMESPFVALFGRQPVTLTALENPSLLPANAPEEKSIRDLAFTMSRLHRRLQHEVEAIKDITQRNATVHTGATTRTVKCGDKVWLIYSDSERARYLRKHGHGVAWRHPFTVIDTKPHAVKLHVPKDGSVPDVLPWQSLRKCAFAAPFFHRDDLPVPTVDDSTTPLVPDDDAVPPTTVSDVSPERPHIDRRAGWTDENSGIVERIVGVSEVAGGWRVHVKWEGYDDPTTGPLSRIKKTVTDPDILEQIARLQDEYLAAHPKLPKTRRAEAAEPQPSRSLPARVHDKPRRWMYPLQVAGDTTRLVVGAGLRSLRRSLAQSNAALLMATCDFANDFADFALVL